MKLACLQDEFMSKNLKQFWLAKQEITTGMRVITLYLIIRVQPISWKLIIDWLRNKIGLIAIYIPVLMTKLLPSFWRNILRHMLLLCCKCKILGWSLCFNNRGYRISNLCIVFLKDVQLHWMLWSMNLKIILLQRDKNLLEMIQFQMKIWLGKLLSLEKIRILSDNIWNLLLIKLITAIRIENHGIKLIPADLLILIDQTVQIRRNSKLRGILLLLR